MQFNELHLSGFKSFVEPTEFTIQPGLTGIVGPNGCGKSNLVEALRWVMGENSAKKMRGSAMDDVIFAGTSTRPARNLAEVTLLLDNSSRRAPPAFNGETTLQLTRRIEREQGSAYSINGQEVRQRDVQLMFADLATGAHSSAIVSQGRVGAIINAKPIDRRSLLEEAAGISGLHSRRHEAELRLKAAENNLSRVTDVIGQLDGQLQNLRRQARQATRYRNIAGHIRRAEAMSLHLRYTEAVRLLAEAQAEFEAAERAVAAHTEAAASARNDEIAQSETLPPIRQREAETAAALHRLEVARDGLDAEERRARDARAQLEARLAQTGNDRAREQGLASDAGEHVNRLDAEVSAIDAARTNETQIGEELNTEAESRLFAVGDAQEKLDRLNERAATEHAERTRLTQALLDADARINRLRTRLAEIAGETERLNADAADIAASEAATEAVTLATERNERARAEHEAAEAVRIERQQADATSREALNGVQSEASRMGAEESGLSRLLAVNEGDLWPPLIDAITVETGFEKALGAALGEELNSAADTAAPIHWEALPPLIDAPALPEGVRPLADVVSAPAVLARRLGQIGLVDDEQGATLRLQLKAGQKLVSRSGALWRWDGYTASAGAPTAASIRLEQRNRLNELREALREVNSRLADAKAMAAAAREALGLAEAAEKAARNDVQQSNRELGQAREAEATANRKSAARTARLAALKEAEEAATHDLGEVEARRSEYSNQFAGLPPENEARDLATLVKADLEQLRSALNDARARLDDHRREVAARVRRLDAIAIERRSWTYRAEEAGKQLEELAQRQSQIEAEIEAIARLPEEIAAKRSALQGEIDRAAEARTAAASELAAAENQLSELARAAREAEATLGQVREERVRTEAAAAHAEQHRQDIAARTREVLDCTPEDVLKTGEVDEGEEIPDLETVEHRLDRLRKERDNMGPVNLRADIEAQEVETQLNALTSERDDLVQAIDKLRQGINSLNKEGRERLLTAFKQVDDHFQRLFNRVFGGGRAHLTLTESDDPLEAGLEIMAQPPGKRLQVMSLLSGGEQALTALSLLFAVFLVNPAPMCVLDEVDAPLDDANVERVCDLISGIAAETNTRFIVVTHHPISMARMDRLYGVTMAERGVSTLVSVDLAGAEALRATA